MNKTSTNPQELTAISTISSTDWLTRALSNDEKSAAASAVATQQQCSSSTGDGNGVCGGKASEDFIERAKAARNS